METGIERIEGAFSDNPVYDELMYKLAELSAKWRGTKENDLAKRYQAVLLTLLEVGWHGNLDVDIELPDELMPEEYRTRHEHHAAPVAG